MFISGHVEDPEQRTLECMSQKQRIKVISSVFTKQLGLSHINEPRIHQQDIGSSDKLKTLYPLSISTEDFRKTTPMLFDAITMYTIMVKTLAPKKGNYVQLDGHTRNLIVALVHGLPFNREEFFLRTLAEAAHYPTGLLPYVLWVMLGILKMTQLNYICEVEH